jgi:hypothetical protein
LGFRIDKRVVSNDTTILIEIKVESNINRSILCYYQVQDPLALAEILVKKWIFIYNNSIFLKMLKKNQATIDDIRWQELVGIIISTPFGQKIYP